MERDLSRGGPRSLDGQSRALAVIGGAILIALLVTSRLLSPDPTGMGTHQKLGLPPCTFMLVFRLPCPSCGMTTAWSHTTRGDLVQAAKSNIGGLLLALAAPLAAAWLLASAWRGETITRPPTEVEYAIAAVALVSITLVNYAVRITLLPGAI